MMKKVLDEDAHRYATRQKYMRNRSLRPKCVSPGTVAPDLSRFARKRSRFAQIKS